MLEINGNSTKICRTCNNRHIANRQARREELQIDAYLERCKEKGCVRCGAKGKGVVLEFDHRIPSTKTFHVTQHGYSLIEIKKEMAKCQVLCWFCHKRKTAMDMAGLHMMHNINVVQVQNILLDAEVRCMILTTF